MKLNRSPMPREHVSHTTQPSTKPDAELLNKFDAALDASPAIFATRNEPN
jgi:hypothetical protein